MKKRKEHPFVTRKKFSKNLILSLKKSKENRVREGEVYAVFYESTDLPTDKWHMISLLFVTEVKVQQITGFNLLYLNEKVVQNILTFAEKENKKFADSKIKALMEMDLNRVPWIYAKKSFDNRNVKRVLRVSRENWKDLVKIDKKSFGNLNEKKLIEDWNLERVEEFVRKTAPKEFQKEQHIKNPDTFEVFEDLNYREVIFDEKKDSLQDLRDEILDDDI
jgi:hypothetical protein